MSSRHQIIARGIDGGHVSLSAMRDLTSWLASGVDRAMRLRIEGRSSAPGRRPEWLVASDDVKITALRAGSLQMEVESTPLQELLPDLFAHAPFWPSAPLADETPFDLLLDGLDDALAGRVDSERIDTGLLSILEEGKTLFSRHGVQHLSFESLSRPRAVVTLDEPRLAMVKTLLAATPQPQHTRIMGTLDGLIASARAFFLELEDGSRLRGVLPSALDPLEINQWFRQEVLVDGQLLFKPSGNLLRIDATGITHATEADARWRGLSRLPASGRRERSASNPASLEDFFGALANAPVRDA